MRGHGEWRFNSAGQWPQEKNVVASVSSAKWEPRPSPGKCTTAPQGQLKSLSPYTLLPAHVQGSGKIRELPKAELKAGNAERVSRWPQKARVGFSRRQGVGGTRKDKQHQENCHFDAEQVMKAWMIME